MFSPITSDDEWCVNLSPRDLKSMDPPKHNGFNIRSYFQKSGSIFDLQAVGMDHSPRKRGRPPKHPKPSDRWASGLAPQTASIILTLRKTWGRPSKHPKHGVRSTSGIAPQTASMDLAPRKTGSAPKHSKPGGRSTSGIAPQTARIVFALQKTRGRAPKHPKLVARTTSGIAPQMPSMDLAPQKRGRRGKHPMPGGRWTSRLAPQTATMDVAPLKRGRPRKHLQLRVRWTSGSAPETASEDFAPRKSGRARKYPQPSGSPGSRSNSARQAACGVGNSSIGSEGPANVERASLDWRGHLRPQFTEELQAREDAYKAALQECEETQRIILGSVCEGHMKELKRLF